MREQTVYELLYFHKFLYYGIIIFFSSFLHILSEDEEFES